MHLSSHKKSKCPISEKEKAFWSSLKKDSRVSIYVTKENAQSDEDDQSDQEKEDHPMVEMDTNTK